MQIRKVWQVVEADHSSTSYEFYSSTAELTKKQRSNLNQYSSRASATKRKVEYTYNSEFGDLPHGAQEQILHDFCDIMVMESFDRWEFSIRFDLSPGLADELRKYECSEVDECGVYVSEDEEAIILSIYTLIDYEGLIYLEPTSVGPKYPQLWYPRFSRSKPFPSLAYLLIHLKGRILEQDFLPLQYIAAAFDVETAELLEEEDEPSALGEAFLAILRTPSNV